MVRLGAREATFPRRSQSDSHLRDGHVQVEEEAGGGGDLEHDHHQDHHGHPHLGRRVPAPGPAGAAGGDHHVGGGLAAHRPEIVLVLLLRAGRSHGAATQERSMKNPEERRRDYSSMRLLRLLEFSFP